MSKTRPNHDGWEPRARIGVVVPHADVGPESELQAMAPEGVFTYGSRVHFGAMRAGGEMDPKIPHSPVQAFVEPPHADNAVELLAASPLDVIALGFTSSAYVLGPKGETELFERLSSRTRGLPLTGTTKAALAGFAALGAKRIAVVDPPWFDEELSAKGSGYFAEHGFTVVHQAACGLPSSQKLITPEALTEWIRSTVAGYSPDAIFVAGNGIRAVGVIHGLEEELDLPLLTANQVLLWHALHLAGRGDVAKEVTAHGRLFQTPPADAS